MEHLNHNNDIMVDLTKSLGALIHSFADEFEGSEITIIKDVLVSDQIFW